MDDVGLNNRNYQLITQSGYLTLEEDHNNELRTYTPHSE
jgi:hypothetical protein